MLPRGPLIFSSLALPGMPPPNTTNCTKLAVPIHTPNKNLSPPLLHTLPLAFQ